MYFYVPPAAVPGVREVRAEVSVDHEEYPLGAEDDDVI